MPFIRRTRDKRGYESTYVMHAYRPTQGPHRTRILYIFRSPAGSRVGRQALDGEVQEALEHTHPDLAFDWQSLLRESAEPPARVKTGRGEPSERAPRPGPPRPPSRPATRPQVPQPAPSPQPAEPIVEDSSLLGQILGVETAARLRARYGEVLQRVARRSRSPEERDRLLERCRRLNPDDWPDEPGIRTASVTVEAEWLAIVAELPARRRGRRGGRRRGHGRGETPSVQPTAGAGVEGGPSGIIEEAGSDGPSEDKRPDWPGDSDSAAGDGGGVGSGPAPATDSSAPEPPDDVPGDD